LNYPSGKSDLNKNSERDHLLYRQKLLTELIVFHTLLELVDQALLVCCCSLVLVGWDVLKFFKYSFVLVVLSIWSAQGILASESNNIMSTFLETKTSEEERLHLHKNILKHFPHKNITVRGKKISIPTICKHFEIQEFDLLLSLYVSGSESFAEDAMEQLLDRLYSLSDLANREFGDGYFVVEEPREKLRQQLFSSFLAASMDPEIYRVFREMEIKLLSGGVTVEDVFVELPLFYKKYQPNLLELDPVIIDTKEKSLLAMRGQQVLGTKVVLQYAHTFPGDKILEIGFGTVPILMALSLILPPDREYLGFDVIHLPSQANRLLKKFRIELFQGNAPKDRSLRKKLKKTRPYAVIFSVDTLLPEGFNPGVSPREYLDFLYEILIDGGGVIVLNDYRREPYFSRQEAVEAGFQIIRWNVVNFLGVHTRQILGDHYPRLQGAGEMSCFVIRKGEMREESKNLIGKYLSTFHK